MAVEDMVREIVTGPGHLRLLVQPTLALLLGVRDGRLDAAAGRRPWVLAVFGAADRHARRALLRGALHSLAIALPLAIGLDLVLQFLIFGSVRSGSRCSSVPCSWRCPTRLRAG